MDPPRDEVAEDKVFLRRGTWFTALGMVAGNIAPLLVILLARTFDPETFGVYVSLQLLVLTCSKLTVLGLDRGLTWYVARHRDRPDIGAQALVSATWFGLGFSLAVIGAVALVSLTHVLAMVTAVEHTDSAFVVACFLALPPWTVLHLHAGALEGVKHPEYRIFLNQSLVTALAPALALLLHGFGLGKWSLPAGLVLANTTGAAVIIVAARRFLPDLRYRVMGRPTGALIAYSWPLGATDVLAGVLLRMDLWMILLLAGPTPAAAYAVMSTLSGGVRAVRQSYDQVMLPVVSGMRADRRRRLPDVFSYAVHMVTTIQLVIAVVVLLFPRELLLLAGKAYVLQPEALAILLAAHLIQGFLGLTGPVVLGLGRSRPLLYLNVASLVINIGLNAWWIPRLGIVGAALAMTTAVLITSLALLALQIKLTRTWIYRSHLWTNAAFIVLFVVCVVAYQPALLARSLTERIILGLSLTAVVLFNGRFSAGSRKDAAGAGRVTQE